MAFIICHKCRAVISLGEDDNLCPNCGEVVIDPEDKNLTVKRRTIPKIYFIVPVVIALFVAFIFLIIQNYYYIEGKVIKIFFATAEDFFNLFFFSLIFGLFLWGLYLFRKQAKTTRKALKEGLKYIGALDSQNLGRYFPELSEKFTKNSFYEAKWREFGQTLKRVENNEKGGVNYCNTIDIAYFFNEDTLFYNRFLSSFIFSMPTMLTGIGIFGTFFGLVVGLQPFKYVTDFSNAKEVSMLTSQLLSGISTAFLSSLWGILFSLLLNFFLSHGKSSICNEIDAFCQKLKELFPRYIFKENEDLEQIKKTLESHTKTIETLSDNLDKRAEDYAVLSSFQKSKG